MLGRVAAVNQRVVDRLVARGIAAVGAAGEGSFPDVDAREFDLVGLGAGIDPETRAALKQRLRGQQPAVELLDVYGPLAAEQIAAALRRAAGAPPVLGELAVEALAEVVLVRVVALQPCRLQVDVFRHRGSPEAEVVPVAAAAVTAGTHTFAVGEAFTGEGHVLVVRADDEVEVRRLG